MELSREDAAWIINSAGPNVWHQIVMLALALVWMIQRCSWLRLRGLEVMQRAAGALEFIISVKMWLLFCSILCRYDGSFFVLALCTFMCVCVVCTSITCAGSESLNLKTSH